MRRFLSDHNGLVEQTEWEPGCWVNIETPDDKDISYLREELKVPESFLVSIADTDEIPRTDREEGWLLTLIRIPLRTAGGTMPFITIPIGIIIRDDLVISLCHYKTELIEDFIAQMQRNAFTVDSKSDLILRLIYASADWFLKYLKEINRSEAEVETALKRSIRNEDLLSLMRLQKSLTLFNTSIKGNDVMIGRLKAIFNDEINSDLYEDVEIEITQASNTVSIYTEILDSTMDAYASVISNNVNEIMKRMTSFSIALMLPTLVASFYGMNVNVGISDSPYAFWIILAVSIALAAGAIVLFRKIKWF